MPPRKDLKDDEILRFFRFSLTESAVATFTEESYDTQLSIDRGIIWLLHFIELKMLYSSVDDPAQNAEEHVEFQITRESKSAMLHLNSPDVIFKAQIEKDRTATIGTDAGPVILGSRAPIIYSYAPPIAYAAQSIHVAVHSTCAAVQTVNGRVGYTLRRVTDKFFYRVASALIS